MSTYVMNFQYYILIAILHFFGNNEILYLNVLIFCFSGNAMSQSLILNGGLNLSLNLSSPGTNIPNMTAQLLDHIKVCMFIKSRVKILHFD